MFKKLFLSALALPAVWAMVSLRAADDSSADAATDGSVKWLQSYFHEAAARYEFSRDEGRTEKLEMVDRPIFHWKQDDDWYGDVFVWDYKGRPEIIGCILASNPTGPSRSIYHEFHSLTEKPLPSVQAASIRWSPSAGTPRLPIADAPRSAETPALRLSQLRKLAREFTVNMDDNGEPWELRLLPQPIYRYSAPEAGVIDGGLFAYVWSKGTDPEFILLLECRETKSEPEWVYCPIRFTNRPLTVTRGNTQVWSCPLMHRDIPNEQYVSFYTETIDVPAQTP